MFHPVLHVALPPLPWPNHCYSHRLLGPFLRRHGNKAQSFVPEENDECCVLAVIHHHTALHGTLSSLLISLKAVDSGTRIHTHTHACTHTHTHTHTHSLKLSNSQTSGSETADCCDQGCVKRWVLNSARDDLRDLYSLPLPCHSDP